MKTFQCKYVPHIAWDTLIQKHYLLIWNSNLTSHPLVYQANLSPGKVRTVKRFSPTKASFKSLVEWLWTTFQLGLCIFPGVWAQCHRQTTGRMNIQGTFCPFPVLSSLRQTAPPEPAGRGKAFSSKMTFLFHFLWVISWIAGKLLLLIDCRPLSNLARQLWKQHGGTQW